MRRVGMIACLAGFAALTGGSLYAWQASGAPSATDTDPDYENVTFAPCAAEPAETEVLAARQAIRAFLSDRQIEARFRTAAIIGAATWTSSYVARLGAYRIDVAVHDHVAPAHPHHRHYAYLVNATGCTIPATQVPNV